MLLAVGGVREPEGEGTVPPAGVRARDAGAVPGPQARAGALGQGQGGTVIFPSMLFASSHKAVASMTAVMKFCNLLLHEHWVKAQETVLGDLTA